MSDDLRTIDGQWACEHCTHPWPSPKAALLCCTEDRDGYTRGYN